MSEIKGQILGIVLVLMIFGIVSGAMVAIFRSLTNNVQEQVNELVDSSAQIQFNHQMLTYK